MTNDGDQWSLNPQKFPQKIELDLPGEVAEYVANRAAATGRSPEEILVELLDRALSETSPPSESP